MAGLLGFAVNFLVLPTLRLRDGNRAVAAASGIAGTPRTIADGLRDGWRVRAARNWCREAVAVERAVRGVR